MKLLSTFSQPVYVKYWLIALASTNIGCQLFSSRSRVADKAEENVTISPLILLNECFYNISMLLQVILELEKLDVGMPDQHLFSLLNS